MWPLLAFPPAFALAFALDRFGTGRRPAGRFDAIIVAGAAVRPDGRASDALARRTALAAELWHQGQAPIVVTTGGTVDHRPTEAQVSADLLVELGVTPSMIRVEGQSRTTNENARYARELCEGDVLVVTDGYHVWRCRRVFARYFRSAEAAGAEPPQPERWRMAAREAGAVVGYAARGLL
jgi:uncharacterized SAM-binding protein YcdF (DUF218 family)